jgi:hypothetical protein
MSAFIITTETMQRVVHAIDKNCTVFGIYPTEPTRNLDKIGEILFKMNEHAVNDRYPHFPKQEAPAFRYRPLGIVSKAEQYFAISCLKYQCTEGDIPETELFKELDKLHDKLAHIVAGEAAIAAKVPWDWSER